MDHFIFLGTKISLTTNETVLKAIKNYIFSERTHNSSYNCKYICVLGLIEILEALINNEVQNSFNNSFLNPLHSRIVEFYAKIKGYKNVKTLDPVWLLTKLLEEDVTHYFYGSDDTTLKKMRERINEKYPKAKVLGYISPPFIALDQIYNNEIIRNDLKVINEQKPDIIWVSLGGLKQVLLMFHHHKEIDNSLMIGVGAVFDCFVGNIRLRPDWMKRMGLSWLYYLVQQPKYRTLKLIRLSHSLIKSSLQNRSSRQKRYN